MCVLHVGVKSGFKEFSSVYQQYVGEVQGQQRYYNYIV